MIECKNIKIKNSHKLILNNISLKIEKGEKILIKGESGSGKSSLIKALLFFQKFSGSVLFDGENIDVSNIIKYRNNIGYIGQKIPGFNQTVESFLSLQNNFKLNRLKRFESDSVKMMLSKLNFDLSILKSDFNSLSGGEKQRIAVIGVLLLDKPLYIFDEITSALDPKNIDSLISLIMENQARTIISVSHNLEWEKMCTRIIKMENGEIIEDRFV